MAVTAEVMQRELIARAVELTAPQFPDLTPSQIQAIRDGDLDSLQDIRPALVRWAIWTMNQPASSLDNYALGYKIQREVLEWLGKKALPDTLRVQVEHEVKPMSDQALAELVMAMRGTGT